MTVTERELFSVKQKYMYTVFEHTVHTDQGKTIVRAYEDTANAQQIYSELIEYAQNRTKVSIDAQDILHYISSSQLGNGSWKGTSHSFILHWQEQVRLYKSLVAQADRLSNGLKHTLLENSMMLIEDL